MGKLVKTLAYRIQPPAAAKRAVWTDGFLLSCGLY